MGSCYYKYDKVGRLVGVEYANAPERNEFYSYDNRGNIQEKHIGAKTYTYSYDASNQLKSMASEDGVREYIYDEAGRLVEEKLNGETEVEYKYGYLDKVTEVIRNGKSVKYAYDGFGMLTEKRFEDGTIEKWVWDGLALVRRGSDIYVNEPHVSGGVPILTKTAEGVRYHENDYLGTTLWSTDTKGNLLSNYSESTVFGEGSLQASRSARFTGKPYDGDMQAYVFPFRNYNPAVARWISSDPSGYPDGVNNQFYACIPTVTIDPLGLKFEYPTHPNSSAAQAYIQHVRSSSYGQDEDSAFYKMDKSEKVVNVVFTDDRNITNNYSPGNNTVYISIPQYLTNNSYTLQGPDGTPYTGSSSIEALLVHEIRHAYDDLIMGDPGYNIISGQYGNEISQGDENAVGEENLFRMAVGEAIRLWYGDLQSYLER